MATTKQHSKNNNMLFNVTASRRRNNNMLARLLSIATLAIVTLNLKTTSVAALPVGEKPYLFQGGGQLTKEKDGVMYQFFQFCETMLAQQPGATDDDIFASLVAEFNLAETLAADAKTGVAVRDFVQRWRIKVEVEKHMDRRPVPPLNPLCAQGITSSLTLPPTYIINLARRGDRRAFIGGAYPPPLLQSPKT
jgi:hypothetical protein